jgi:SAM-dependent methyltransferase
MTLSELILPNDPRFHTHADEIFRAREDLKSTFGTRDNPEFHKWLVTFGVLEYADRLASFYPPLPPEDIRRTGCGGIMAYDHLKSGVDDFETLVEIWRMFCDRPMAELSRVFDFGCGCGRTLRWFTQAFRDLECWGCDVRLAGIEWCRQNLRGEFLHTETTPPLPVESDSVDLVYALSLFSHFERDSSIAWIAELARVCKPDGYLIVTTHGAFSLWAMHLKPEQTGSLLDGGDVIEAARRLQRESFMFHRPPKEWLEKLDGSSEDYGMCFLTEHFVREAWREHVEVVAFVPVALFMFQDVYVLRPRNVMGG